jgi:hypothetical protein
LAETPSTALRWFSKLSVSGLDTTLQAPPFQRSVRVRLPLLELLNPTAQAWLAEVASTSRSSPPPGGSGLAEMLQLLPFQRSITGRWMGRVPVSARPTAQALLDESASAPQRTLENWVRLGLDTAVQVAAAAGEASASSATASRIDHRARRARARDQCGRWDDRMAPPDDEAHTTAKKFLP